MTKARIREIRAAAKKCGEGWMPAMETMVIECLETIIQLQSFTRRGADDIELPHKAKELLSVQPNLKKLARGTIEEVQDFARKAGMPRTDGEFLFHHFEGKGWKDVKDWRAHFRKWKSASWLPSQKGQNGKPVRSEPPGVNL